MHIKILDFKEIVWIGVYNEFDRNNNVIKNNKIEI
jgi:hypothetical protein